MSRVLVTGAAGFIGRATVATLSRGGHQVTGVDRVAGHRSGFAAEEMTLDFADPKLLRGIESGEFDAVVHLAAIVDTTSRDRDLMLRENTEKAIELASRARRGGAAFISASSFSVYGRIEGRHAASEGEESGRRCSGPLNPYAESKLLLDQALTETLDGAPFWAALRFTNVFGAGEERKGAMASMAYKVARASALGKPLELFDDTLDAARDYIPVEVVAERIGLMLAGGPSGIYNMGSGTAVTFASLLEWCRSRAPRDSDLALIANPYAGAYQYWTCADMGRWRSRFAPEAPATIGEPDLRRAIEQLVDQLC